MIFHLDQKELDHTILRAGIMEAHGLADLKRSPDFHSLENSGPGN